MDMERKKLAIIGFGGRGHIYGDFARKNPDKFRLVAVAETDEGRREDAERNFGAKGYADYREMFSAGEKFDLVAVATQDRQHKEHAVYALERGCDILLEKPIAVTEEDCFEIYRSAKRSGRKVYVCHVLRYTPFYSGIRKLIDAGAVGDIVNIHASENVGFYHQAHSYVRGPWRNSGESSPMILAKCCHDMDIIRYLIGERCISVNSYGALSYFRAENAPEKSAIFCSDCPSADKCIYNAQKLYLQYVWTAGYFTKGTLTESNILRDLKYSQYDRCVYRCDNDVVDHQSTVLLFERGKTAVHTMTAFSREIYRDIKIYGTKAELVGVLEDNFTEVRPFGGEIYRVEVNNDAPVGGHCGGDYYMMMQIWKDMNGLPCEGVTYLDVSLESHLMAFAAEKSRLNAGRTEKIRLREGE